MRNNILSGIVVALVGAGICSCTSENVEPEVNPGKMRMEFSFSHPETTRATETAFEEGDNVGLFVYSSDRPLEIAGNIVNDERLTYDGSKWSSSRPLYWDSGEYGIAAYYPYMEDISSISDLPFKVATDQTLADSGNGLSGYEASDFLYASKRGVSASSDPVNMTFRHIMSKISIRLVKGEDYEGELPATAEVFIHNTVPMATIDLSVGIATKEPRGGVETIKARKSGTATYAAIVVPQRLENRVPLVEVVMDGVSYLFESKFLFKPGVHHLVNLVIDKNPEQIKIEIGGEIVNWN